MIEKRAEILGIWNRVNSENLNVAVCITTNGMVKKDGTCVMGRGVAKLFATVLSDLPKRLGELIKEFGNIPFHFPEYKIISFPVKHHWKEDSDVTLIKSSCHRLNDLLEKYKFDYICLPRPGCGNGNLDWETQVKPAIKDILISDKIIIIDRKHQLY